MACFVSPAVLIAIVAISLGNVPRQTSVINTVTHFRVNPEGSSYQDSCGSEGSCFGAMEPQGTIFCGSGKAALVTILVLQASL